MYVNDPYDKIQPPVNLTEPEEEEILIPSLDSAFWDEIPSPQEKSAGTESFPLHVDVCRFDEAGNHTLIADNCPHFVESDELGRNIKSGWTVQSISQ